MQKRSSVLVTTLIAGAFFMENLDGTIIATALPQMAASFHMGAVHLNIAMTAYLVTLAVFIPISGWVADRFGPVLFSPRPSASSPSPQCSAAYATLSPSSRSCASYKASAAP